MIYYCDKELKTRLHILEEGVITIYKNTLFDVSTSKGAFLLYVFQITVIALVSVLNHCDINVLDLF